MSRLDIIEAKLHVKRVNNISEMFENIIKINNNTLLSRSLLFFITCETLISNVHLHNNKFFNQLVEGSIFAMKSMKNIKNYNNKFVIFFYSKESIHILK